MNRRQRIALLRRAFDFQAVSQRPNPNAPRNYEPSSSDFDRGHRHYRQFDGDNLSRVNRRVYGMILSRKNFFLQFWGLDFSL